MSVQLHQIIEVDCHIDNIDSNIILARIPEGKIEGEDKETALEHVSFVKDECLVALRPRGVYKLFNPAICTLPPAYKEPAIKLVGTMAVLHGECVYERMRKAKHCVMVGATLDSTADIQALHDRLCRTEQDMVVFEACLSTLIERTTDITTTAVIKDAMERGLQTDDLLSPGDDNFPLDSADQLMFYLQVEKRLGMTLNDEGTLEPRWSSLGVIGMYDKSQKGRRRACGRCKFREFCSIRAIGMNCHGRKGSFS